MPKPKDGEPAAHQPSFFSVLGPPLPPEPHEDEFPPLDIVDPEANLARVHEAMQKRRHREPIIDNDISHEVEAQRKALLQLWGVPSGAEKKVQLLESFQEAIAFLEVLPFRGTTAMNYMTANNLTYQDIEELRAILAGRYQIFADPDSSDGFRRLGTEAAYYQDQTTSPRTPRKFLKKK